MAAIFGLIGPSERWELDAMAERLRHRGREASSWAPKAQVRFGSCRAPTDQASGLDGAVPLMFTGSILNRDELARRIGGSARCAGMTDAELLWSIYLRHGTDGFAFINGQCAIALYDARTDEVVLAADRWATQPLYAGRIAGGWAFATEYAALLASPRFEANIDANTVEYLQATKYLPIGKTLLADVHAVPPGGVLRLSRDQCRSGTYPPLKLDISSEDSEETLAEELRETLLAATRRAIAGYDRIGIALSAGLDSTLTVGLVRAVAPDAPVHTYTASFDPDDPDLALAAETARHFRTIHREIILAPDDLPRLLPHLVWAMEDPYGREEMLVYHVLAHEAAMEVPIILYGHMADVLFGGMPRHLLIKLAGDLPYLREPLTGFYDYTQTGRPPQSILGRLLVTAYYRSRRTPCPSVVGAHAAVASEQLNLASAEPLNMALLESIRAPTEVASMERLHTRASINFASAFHDIDVARCAFRIPDQFKIRGRCRKYILRRAAQGILPPHLAARPKGLIRITQNRRLWRVVEAMAAELLSPQAVAARGLFEPRQIQMLLKTNRRKNEEQFYRIWTLLLTELWCRTFIDARGAPYVLPANPYARLSTTLELGRACSS